MAEAGEILIEYQAAEDATQYLLNVNGQLIDTIDNLHSSILQWEDSAKGMSRDQFEQKFAEWKQRANSVGDAIRLHSKALMDIVEGYQTTDAGNASRMANTATS
ncbi:WXG100 family type VII secretion target [Streptomyces sp. NPDC058469]|uniref:WXG100 family type VII secretion target n=1 Tax=Streptomyces sp. NPDC058469 TaxID=3346514 RepID=UPI003651202F